MGAISDRIREAGVVGAGGAGFPAHVKAAAPAELVIANGAECEPLLHADAELMEHHADSVIAGLAALMESVGAKKGIISIKEKNQKAVAAVRPALKGKNNIVLRTLPDIYPSGDEHVLVYDLTGRVVPEGGIPLHVGVVVQNVATLSQIAAALEGHPVIDRLVTVTGAVKKPATLRAPIGTSFKELIDFCGGPAAPEIALLVGGPMMGRYTEDLSEPLAKTCSGIVALPRDHYLCRSKSASLEALLYVNRTVCCQCTLCTQMCPRYLLGHNIRPHLIMRSSQHGEPHTEGMDFAGYCSECGVCTYFACPMGISPSIIVTHLKKLIFGPGKKIPQGSETPRPRGTREYVRTPTPRLAVRLGLMRYDAPTRFLDNVILPKSVRILLKQHTGEAAVAVVKKGQKVSAGELIGEIPAGKLGARVHASIDGVIKSVDDKEVVIQR